MGRELVLCPYVSKADMNAHIIACQTNSLQKQSLGCRTVISWSSPAMSCQVKSGHALKIVRYGFPLGMYSYTTLTPSGTKRLWKSPLPERFRPKRTEHATSPSWAKPQLSAPWLAP